MCFRPPSASKKVICPACGTMNSSMARKCFKCKADMPVSEPEPAICPRCGMKNPAKAKVCSACGMTAAEAIRYQRE